jgi:hypothetical protein
MPASILDETKLGLAAAARRFPPLRAERPRHPATLTRWIQRGILGPGGQRVRLEAVRAGGSWITSIEAIERFMATLSARSADDETVLPMVRTPAQRQSAAERAGKELEAVGI